MALDTEKYDVLVADSRWDRPAFRLEHWLLSPGSSDMAQLRGYLRVKAWRDCRSPRTRLHAIKAVVKFPARALRDSWRAVIEYGGHVAPD